MTSGSDFTPALAGRGEVTLGEIRQQPELWKTTLDRVSGHPFKFGLAGRAAIICGAGSSAYAASAVAGGWDNTRAIPSTDLLLYSKEELLRLMPGFGQHALLVSLARSGDSPESTAVVDRIQRMFPEARQLAITCNAEGRLAGLPGVDALVLDPRTNDRSLVMTSSFSNLILAGLALVHQEKFSRELPKICDHVTRSLPRLESIAESVALSQPDRFVTLTSADMAPLGQEACLKVVEMTAGRVTAMAESFLGVRHGPMSFLRHDSVVLCVLSSDLHKRRYEEDVLLELRQKKLGQLVVVGPIDMPVGLSHVAVPAMAPDLPGTLRTPFEVVFPQLLAYHLSLATDLDPDNPSPDGVITRVVQTFRLHEPTV